MFTSCIGPVEYLFPFSQICSAEKFSLCSYTCPVRLHVLPVVGPQPSRAARGESFGDPAVDGPVLASSEMFSPSRRKVVCGRSARHRNSANPRIASATKINKFEKRDRGITMFDQDTLIESKDW